MKKLGVILLAMAFVFGLAIQASAGFEWVPLEDKDDVFDKDKDVTIDFYDVPVGEEILDYYWLSSGVKFLGGVYGDLSFYSNLYFEDPPTVTNLYIPNVQGQNSGEIVYEPVVAIDFRDRITHVGFDVAPWGSTITVKAFRDGAEPCQDNYTLGAGETFIGIKDQDGIDAIEIGGDAQILDLMYIIIDNLTFGGVIESGPEEVEVVVEIKPPNCLGAQIPFDAKKINHKSKGVTPVVIVGNGTYDVTKIDPSTVRLQGVPPVRDAIEDASTCNAEGGDGELDLALKFNTQELVGAMGVSLVDVQAMEKGEWPSKSLQLTGNLFEESGGAAIKGEVSVTLVGKVKENMGKGKNK